MYTVAVPVASRSPGQELYNLEEERRSDPVCDPWKQKTQGRYILTIPGSLDRPSRTEVDYFSYWSTRQRDSEWTDSEVEGCRQETDISTNRFRDECEEIMDLMKKKKVMPILGTAETGWRGDGRIKIHEDHLSIQRLIERYYRSGRSLSPGMAKNSECVRMINQRIIVATLTTEGRLTKEKTKGRVDKIMLYITRYNSRRTMVLSQWKFRAGRSTMDQISTQRMYLERSWECDCEEHIGFLDLEPEISAKLINVIKSTYHTVGQWDA